MDTLRQEAEKLHKDVDVAQVGTQQDTCVLKQKLTHVMLIIDYSYGVHCCKNCQMFIHACYIYFVSFV